MDPAAVSVSVSVWSAAVSSLSADWHPEREAIVNAAAVKTAIDFFHIFLISVFLFSWRPIIRLSSFPGSRMFNKIATSAAGTMPEPPKNQLYCFWKPGQNVAACSDSISQSQCNRNNGMFLDVMACLVISWIPLTTMEENIMTAAPPRTL